MTSTVGGRIARIKLKGFMTYDELEIKPDKGLNLIVGLNGSGKSSIMSAICLGLGGKPQFTGRAVTLAGFIKYDHTKAVIEIELESSRGKNDVICRVIQNDKHLWYWNNKPVGQSEIMSVIKKYNIDMGNLCQFLPQEKVAEFAKMDKKQRLVNMIQAIGDPSLMTLYNDLKTLRNDFCRFGKELEELENNKASEQKINDRLKPDIDKHDERQQLKIQLKILRFKRMVCQYELLQCSVKEKDTKRKQLRLQVSNTEGTLERFLLEKTNLSADSRKFSMRLQTLKQDIYSYMKKLSESYEYLGKCHEEIDNAKIGFENKMLEKQEQATKLNALTRQIEAYEDMLFKNKDRIVMLQNKQQEIDGEYENVKQQFCECDSELERENLLRIALDYKRKSKQEEIKRISNEENKKYEVLRQRHPDTYTALMWLKENESSFRKPILPPAIVSIKIRDDRCRAIIENTVSENDLRMFVCQDKGDLDRFMNIVIKEKKLSVNVSMEPDLSLSYRPPPITQQMRNLGIDSYLMSLFTAPEPVMRLLCQLCKVHSVPVCNESAERNIDSILKYFPLFYTPSERITGKRSRYGQQSMSIKRDVLVGRNILPNIQDNSEALISAQRELQEVERALVEINPRLKKLEGERTLLERQQEQLRLQKKSIMIEIKKLNELEWKLAQLKDSYNKKVKEVIDEAEEKRKVTTAICNLNSKKVKMLAEIQKSVKEILLLKKERCIAILQIRAFQRKISALMEKISNLEAELQKMKSQLSEVESERTRLKADGVQLFADIQAVDISKEYALAVFNETHDLAEVEQEITNLEAQIELTDEDIAPILAEYTKRKQTIQSIEEQVSSLKNQIKDLKVRIQEKKESWLPPLETHIENVNEKFSKYYKRLKCAGEICLDQTDDTDDFPNYGLQIKLKYRVNEEFMELSEFRHSGGECSVAAIIFILSLQELTDVPFRCIDEINQGMDAVNERNIYQLVADAARSGSCSQYFLLTPKLLMDLSYHKDIAVHIIFNSQFMQTKLNVRDHIKIARANRQ